jgi:hypothetical protein
LIPGFNLCSLTNTSSDNFDRRTLTAVSEELENSLQQAIESYLGERLRAIDEQLSRLQIEFSEALTHLREASVNESLDGTSLSAAIFAHLQTARGQKLSGAVPERTESSGEVVAIKRAVEEIEKQQSQADVLRSLLTSAAQFAERAALFVIKNEQAIGWRVCEASDPTNLEMIGGVSLPLTADTFLTRAARSRSAWAGAPESNSEDPLLIDQLGGEPQTVAAVPLVARGKVVALLYADSMSPDPNAVNLDALDVLARVASMAVTLVSVPRAIPETPAVQASVEVAPAPKPEPTYTPEIEPQTTEVFAEPAVEEVSAEPAPQIEPQAPEVFAAPAREEVSAEPAPQIEPPAREVFAEPVVERTSAEAAPEPVPETPETEAVAPPPAPTDVRIEPEQVVQPPPAPAPSFVSQYATPLGSSRRFGVNEPELPIEVGEEERRLHNDARRFARLLVSEIKLYNEPKVKEGRSQGDLYDRLREDIDRSRQMYDKRVAPPVAARHDYFHQELVNTLAEGDPAKLGGSYPGAVVSAN